MANMNGYDLSRKFWDFSFENPDKIRPAHAALYFFSIEHCNRMGWKLKFGLPTTMAMEALGIKSYNTYSKTLRDLVDWGFVTMIERSKNQYSANIIALSYFDKALDKAMIKHTSKQSESTRQSIDSIDKHLTFNIKHKNIQQLIVSLCDFFKVNEMNNPRAFFDISNFANVTCITEEMFNAYKEYKSENNEKIHGWRGFIGTAANNFEEGAWCDCDWREKLKTSSSEGSIPAEPSEAWIAKHARDPKVYQKACAVWREHGWRLIKCEGSTVKTWIQNKQLQYA